MTNPRTAAATAAASRKAQEARAEYLRARGWTCIPPEWVQTSESVGSRAPRIGKMRVEFVRRDPGEPTDGGCE